MQPTMTPSSRATSLVALALLAAPLVSRSAAQVPPFRYQYAAKVVCGAVRQGVPLVSQSYATIINVNNASDSLTVFFRKWLVVTDPPGMQQPQPPLEVMNDTLIQRFALSNDCRDLWKRNPKAPRPFFDGFVVIQSTLPLDVVGVYTVPGGVDVVSVAERQIYVGK